MDIDKNGLMRLRIVIGIVFLYTLIFQLTDNAFTLITPALIDTYNLSTGVGSWVASIGGMGVAVGFLLFSSFTDFFNEQKITDYWRIIDMSTIYFITANSGFLLCDSWIQICSVVWRSCSLCIVSSLGSKISAYKRTNNLVRF